MRYETYFHPGQAITLRRRLESPAGERLEDCHGVLLRRYEERFDIALTAPLAPALPPLVPGEALELISTRYGLGLRLGATCGDEPEPDVVGVTALGDLQIFYRRQHLRLDLELWLGLLRQADSPQPLHRLWEEALDQRGAGQAPTLQAPLARQRCTLGAGGLGLSLPAAAVPGETLLCLLHLEDRQPPVAALAEILWAQPPEARLRTCGLRFCAILAADQERIDRHVNALCRDRQRADESGDCQRSYPV